MAFKKSLHNFTVVESQNLALGQNGAVIIDGDSTQVEVAGPFISLTTLAASVVDTSECTTNLSGTVPATFPIPAGTTISTVSDPTFANSGLGTFTTSNSVIADITTIVNNASIVILSDSDTWSSYKSGTPSENQDDYQDDSWWPHLGDRRGLDPTHSQSNGSFFIDETVGKIHFSSNISGKTVILKYISDGLGTDSEAIVHKFAEEAMYKSIAHAVLSTTISGQPLAPSFQQQKSAAIRTAKLRLSNLKIEELTQIMRGKSKFIKH